MIDRGNLYPPMTIAGASDKVLFTPGPLTTSRTVKQAMLRDVGSRDVDFIRVVREVRRALVELGGGGSAFEAILMQGSGTFGVESVVSSVVPRSGKMLVVVNGAYGKRIARMAEVLQIERAVLTYAEDTLPDVSAIASALAGDRAITHVAMVHSETTTGLVNPIEGVGRAVRAAGRTFLVDAMSSFGAIPIDLEESCVDFLVSSANKCIEGVPGFSFVLARREALLASEGNARSLSLDLHAQWRGLEADGQFRFTPPTHAILAFHQALRELADEGGVAARGARYRECQRTLARGMAELGFEAYLRPELQGPIITTFRYPAHPRFDFEQFYERLSRRGFVIYPGKLTNADCFRIGTIGRLFPGDVTNLLSAIRDVMKDMGVGSAAPPERKDKV
jgi:2-aminoethylphosphonate-pyruvate transaminase